MTTLKCKACGGTFHPTQPDGSRYFHVCGALSAGEKRAALDAGTLQLSARQMAQLVDARARDAELTAIGQESHAEDLFWTATPIARPNARNENVDPRKWTALLGDDGKLPAGVADDDVIVSVGAGVEPVND